MRNKIHGPKLEKKSYREKDVESKKERQKRLRKTYIRKRSVDEMIIGSAKAVATAVTSFAVTAILNKYFKN